MSASPHFRICPKGKRTLADRALDLLASNVRLDSWQADWIRDSLLVEDGGLAADETLLVCPRQNGKNHALAALEIVLAIGLGWSIVHTAHRFGTALRHLLRLEQMLSHGPLKREVVDIRRSNGKEGIEFRGGATIDFVARTRHQSRGFSEYSAVVLDEGFAMPADVEAAVVPILSAKQERSLVVVTSTSPRPELESAWLRRQLLSLYESESEHVVCHEWRASDDADIDDEDAWRAANPAYPHRITRRAIQRERRMLSEADFRIERLGIWEHRPEDSTDVSSTFVVDQSAWNASIRSGFTLDDPVVFGFDIQPDRTSGAIVAASTVRDEPSLLGVDLVWHGRVGLSDIRRRLSRLMREHRPQALVYDGRSQAAFIVADIRAEAQAQNVELRALSLTELSDAAARLVYLVEDGRLAHLDDPLLADAVSSTRRRQRGDLWWLDRSSSTTACILSAAAMALIAASPERQQSANIGIW